MIKEGTVRYEVERFRAEVVKILRIELMRETSLEQIREIAHSVLVTTGSIRRRVELIETVSLLKNKYRLLAEIEIQ